MCTFMPAKDKQYLLVATNAGDNYILSPEQAKKWSETTSFRFSHGSRRIWITDYYMIVEL